MGRILYVSKSRLKNTLNEYNTIHTSIATWKDRMETQNRNISESNEGATAETYTEKTTAYNESELTTLIGHVDQMRTALVEAHIKTKSLIARSEDFENILRGEGAESSDTYANISSSGDIASYYDDFCSQDGYTGAIKDNTDSIKELGIDEEENLTGIETELGNLKTITVSIEDYATHIRDCITKQNYTDPLYDSLKKYCIDIAIMHELVKYTRDMYFPVLDGPREHNRSYDYDGAPTEDKEDIYVMFLKEMGYSKEDIEVLKRYTGLTAGRLYDQISHMPASEVSNMIRLAYESYGNANSDPFSVISDQTARKYIQTLDLTEQQMQWIANLENAQGYNCSVGDLQIVAASLFASGFEPAFVAGMLGNMCHEGDIGHLENVNAGTNTQYDYWNFINECRIPPLDEEHKNYEGKCYTYKTDFADKHLYEVDFQVYKQLVDQDKAAHKDFDKVIGCGCVQWTHKGRFDLLMSYYDAADKNGDNNGQLSYEECLVAETQCMSYELTHNYKDENGYYSYKTKVTDAWTNNWKTENDNGEVTVINTVDSASDAAGRICNDYEKPDSKNSHIDERKRDAKSLFVVMMGDD